MLPALITCLYRVFERIAAQKDDVPKKPVVILVRSDGMGKQKNIAHRAMLTMAQAYPELISNVEHDTHKGRTTANCGRHGAQVEIVVCSDECEHNQFHVEVSWR